MGRVRTSPYVKAPEASPGAQHHDGLEEAAFLRRAAERGVTIPPDRIADALEGAEYLTKAMRLLEAFARERDADVAKP